MEVWRRIFREAVRRGASDIHLREGALPFIRSGGVLCPLDVAVSGGLLGELLESWLSGEAMSEFHERHELDFAHSEEGRRLRVNAFCHLGGLALSIRLVPEVIPTLDEIGAPAVFGKLMDETSGLVLVSGKTGAGKTTTLASFLSEMAGRRALHIITLEDPIEYVHVSGKSLFSQREYGTHFASFASALKSALREDPDVIMVGEMRDADTISTALSAAETGHLVLSSLHTGTAGESVMRIASFFPAERQDEIRAQLSIVLRAVVVQQLLPAAPEKQSSEGLLRVAAFEVLTATPAVRNLIRGGKVQQLPSCMLSGGASSMQTMQQSVEQLFSRRMISREVARLYAGDTSAMGLPR